MLRGAYCFFFFSLSFLFALLHFKRSFHSISLWFWNISFQLQYRRVFYIFASNVACAVRRPLTFTVHHQRFFQTPSDPLKLSKIAPVSFKAIWDSFGLSKEFSVFKKKKKKKKRILQHPRWSSRIFPHFYARPLLANVFFNQRPCPLIDSNFFTSILC